MLFLTARKSLINTYFFFTIKNKNVYPRTLFNIVHCITCGLGCTYPTANGTFSYSILTDVILDVINASKTSKWESKTGPLGV